MRFCSQSLLVLLLSVVLIYSCVYASEESAEDFRKLPVKKLKEILKRKGAECKGCSEKAEFVEKVIEVKDLPDIEEEVKPPVDERTEEEKAESRRKMDELMEMLKKNGMGNAQMFNADDMKNMSPEEIAARMGGGRRPPPLKNKKSSKKGKSKKDNIVSDETIEL